MKKKLLLLIVTVMSLVCCDRDDEIYDPAGGGLTEVDDIIKFSPVTDSVADADTASVLYLETFINPKTADSNRQVTFSTNLGQFLNLNDTMAITADVNGHARIGIKSASPGTATVSATVKTFTISRTFSFTPATPDILVASADKYVAAVDDSVIVTIKLLRNPGRGIINDPTRVWFAVRNLDDPDEDDNLIVVSSYAESSDQTATVVIKNPFELTGNFEIEAATPKNGTVKDKVKVRIE